MRIIVGVIALLHIQASKLTYFVKYNIAFTNTTQFIVRIKAAEIKFLMSNKCYCHVANNTIML